jgi:hypothetical protein
MSISEATRSSLHNPWAGGYYPSWHSASQESNELMAEDADSFKLTRARHFAETCRGREQTCRTRHVFLRLRKRISYWSHHGQVPTFFASQEIQQRGAQTV